ncbi:MAG: PqqD family protein [Chloroflexi bacterium]|nr:PqqD family protein [Chloroflexota bacterium]
MPSQDQHPGKTLFISSALRPPVGPDLDGHPPLAAETPREEIERLSRAVLAEADRAHFGLVDAGDASDLLGRVLVKRPDLQETVLDGEAVLLDLDRGTYYTLNGVGTAIWDLLTGERPLAGVLAAIVARFEVAEDVARADLTAFAMRLLHRGLVVERG